MDLSVWTNWTYPFFSCNYFFVMSLLVYRNTDKKVYNMDYYDSAEGQTLTKSQAWVEIVRKHNLDEQEFELFLKDCGDKKTYDAQIVLAWLGY